jgi:hypothetical protein
MVSKSRSLTETVSGLRFYSVQRPERSDAAHLR